MRCLKLRLQSHFAGVEAGAVAGASAAGAAEVSVPASGAGATSSTEAGAVVSTAGASSAGGAGCLEEPHATNARANPQTITSPI